MRLLLQAHPEGLVVGEIGAELGIPPSTLSHHLDKLKNEGLVGVRRESTFLRYTANTTALQEIVAFLFAECCTRNKAIRPEAITCACPLRRSAMSEAGIQRSRAAIATPRARSRRERLRPCCCGAEASLRVEDPITSQSLRRRRRTARCRRRPCWPRSAAAIRPRWPS